ncbi:hypothetical protein LTR56_002003 [Elasticomyces elasticus]|nr:hypothetical protein LTR22_011588 [Elasticomyces elasticus]KAK3658147.1 hypothetical protein LTR56_002003 [Elasticomyces elasticus]KAK4906023.1 hypothetical protein LTR49_024754 [Elasticomyces elasticus]KAK5764032.1 hypothetical protein LTS12_005725 [Elasticomyces elasticus]
MPSRTTQTVFSEGILHGLPTFPDHEGKKYSAIVTGANGISGSEIVNALAAAPERWEKIYALSRRPPTNDNPRVHGIAVDFLDSSPEEIASSLKQSGVKADYVFYTSYMQPATREGQGLWSNTDELDEINVKLFTNFLEALAIAKIIPKRILLQTGGKHYALHHGPTTVPMTEGTPNDRYPHANFYFPQEDALTAWCTKHGSSWNVTRPGFIIGANPTAAINITYPLAIYASVQKELGGKLEFPSDAGAWDAMKDLSTASLIGRFSEWAVLTEEAANEAFNIVDDSPFAYGKFWPTLASWYGLQYATPTDDEEAYTVVTLPASPPPRGFGKAGQVKLTFTFEQWSLKAEVKAAWKRIVERSKLDPALDLFGPGREQLLDDTFRSLDAEMLGSWGRIETMDKAKKLGWHGHVQTDEGIRGTLEKMMELKMVPAF